jgi:predicted nucleotidyltransferase component of viral defense system
MKKSPKDMGASARARLQRIATERGDDFQNVLTRYANERLLFRLSQSDHAANFVLKGATLFAVWTGIPHRPTRDLDLLGFGEADIARVRDVFAEVLAVTVPDDGVRFDASTLKAALIREEQQYGGIRVTLVARIAAAKVNLQIDVGFGDAITPEASQVEVPTLLDFPAPRLRAYPRETVVAEKVEAIVQLGSANTRMKDFYDLAVLAEKFEFECDVLARALRATFERRKTKLPTTRPVALTSAFFDDPSKKTQWTGFVRKSGVSGANSLAETVAVVAAFIEVPLEVASTRTQRSARWLPRGPWRDS